LLGKKLFFGKSKIERAIFMFKKNHIKKKIAWKEKALKKGPGGLF